MKKILLFIVCLVSFLYRGIGQNYGIGVPNPAFKLDIGGRLKIRTGTYGNASASSGIWLEDYRDGTNQAFFGMQDSIRLGFYGLNGIGWGFNFNSLNGNLHLVNGYWGSGTNTPINDIDIYRPDPSIGFFDNDADNHSSGSISADSTNLFINAYRRSSVGLNEEGNLILQANTGGFPNFIAGRIGIGTSFPDVKLHIDGGSDVTMSGGGYLQLGSSSSANIGLDPNEIQARNNGTAIKLGIQSKGGGLQINSGTGTINFPTSGELNRNSVTGTINMLPVCFGKIKDNGSIASGTGNFTATRVGNGTYELVISGESISSNPDQYIIMATCTMITGFDLGSLFITAQIQSSGNAIRFYTKIFKVDYLNDTGMGGCGFDCVNGVAISAIQNLPSPRFEDNSFCFIIYKL